MARFVALIAVLALAVMASARPNDKIAPPPSGQIVSQLQIAPPSQLETVQIAPAPHETVQVAPAPENGLQIAGPTIPPPHKWHEDPRLRTVRQVGAPRPQAHGPAHDQVQVQNGGPSQGRPTPRQGVHRLSRDVGYTRDSNRDKNSGERGYKDFGNDEYRQRNLGQNGHGQQGFGVGTSNQGGQDQNGRQNLGQDGHGQQGFGLGQNTQNGQNNNGQQQHVGGYKEHGY